MTSQCIPESPGRCEDGRPQYIDVFQSVLAWSEDGVRRVSARVLQHCVSGKGQGTRREVITGCRWLCQCVTMLPLVSLLMFHLPPVSLLFSCFIFHCSLFFSSQ